MRKSFRKLIAKEVIILVSSALLSILLYSGFWAFNTFYINRKSALTVQLSKTKEKINAIHIANSNELGKRVKEHFSEYADNSDEEVGLRMSEKYPDYFEVYAEYLKTKNLKPNYTSDSFYRDLQDSTNAYRFYEYIQQKNLKSPNSIGAFLTIVNHQLLPPPPPKELVDDKKALEAKIKKLDAKIYTKQELHNTAKWLITVILFLVYPVRLILITRCAL